MTRCKDSKYVNSKYIDSHCHFDFSEFNANREQLWQACRDLGIQALVIPGVEPEQWQSLALLCRSHHHWYYGVGIHPWWSQKYAQSHTQNQRQDQSNHFVELANAHVNNKRCVAIGECGLDGIKSIDWDIQQQVFALQLSAAKELKLPVIVHCVKAHNEMIRFLKSYQLEKGGVIHAFSGSLELARQYWALGFYLGVGGIITYERARKTRLAVAHMPCESLLLETDAPDMLLSGQRKGHNTPESVLKVAECLAVLRNEPVEGVADQTTANAIQLFGLNCLT